MFQKFYTLALNTFLETMRQPIFGVILVATGLMMMLNVGLAGFTLDDDDKLLLDLGLSTLLLSGLFLASFSAASVLSREIETKTVLTVISKPVSRPLFIFGKYAGLMGALGVAFYLSFLAFAFAQRHGVLQTSNSPWDLPVFVFGLGGVLLAIMIAGFCNYFYGTNFMTTAVGLAVVLLTIGLLVTAVLDEKFNVIEFGSNLISWQVVIAGYLVFLALMIVAAVALAASTRFGYLLTLLICTTVLGAGIVSDYAIGQYEEQSTVAAIAYRVVPNIGPFWIVDGLISDSEETKAPFKYVVYATAYAGLISFGILNIGVFLFQKREVG